MEDHGKLRTHHHYMLLRCISFQTKKRTYHLLSYRLALEKKGSESIEMTVRRRSLVLAASILRLGDHRFLKRLIVGILRDGTGSHRVGRPEQSWWQCLTDDRKVFGILEPQWQALENDCDVWTERVDRGAATFMAKWRAEDLAQSKAQHAKEGKVTSGT